MYICYEMIMIMIMNVLSVFVERNEVGSKILKKDVAVICFGLHLMPTIYECWFGDLIIYIQIDKMYIDMVSFMDL